MFSKIRDFVLYAGTDKESYLQIKDSIENTNQRTSMVFSSVAFVLIFTMAILSCFVEGFMASRNVYICGTVFALVLLLLSFGAKKYPALTYVGVYLAISGFMLYGIALGTITRPTEATVTFMVMLLLMPLIFIDKPIKMALCLIFYIIVFIVAAFNTKTGATLSVDVSDAIIFGLLAIASGSIVIRAKIKGYVLENRLHIMSETDQLTGLNNRNCYEWKLKTYHEVSKKSLGCIYVDVNGLHDLNNTKGHKAGDEMLKFIANEVRKQFGVKDTYRIGGDEFVAFAIDGDEEAVERKVRELVSQVEEKGYHTAVGYEVMNHSELDVNQLIVQAESKMYKDKSEYYKNHDRRART
jgi:diguanylate cyclase (GGDEF)-like protein